MNHRRLTICYKKFGNACCFLDIYPPLSLPSSRSNTKLVPSIPAVVYFHGGGLTVGNRQSWFPTWIQRRVFAAGFAFVSADYQLIPHATGHSIVQDIQDLFAFLAENDDLSSYVEGVFSDMTTPTDCAVKPFAFKIDPDAIAVAGSSAGGLCAYLAAMHCVSPRPVAVLSMYGMGGDFLTSHYLTPKNEIFFRGRELLNPTDFMEYIHPFPPSPEPLQPTTDSPLAYHPKSYRIPGYPANPRMLLARLYLQLGVFLDYYTGAHEQSLSSTLRRLLDQAQEHDMLETPTAEMKVLIPDRHLSLFPQFGVTPAWPPTFLCHGSSDSAVPVHESRHMYALLQRAGVPVELLVFPEKEHSFDYEPDAEELYEKEFDRVGEFLERWLGGTPPS